MRGKQNRGAGACQGRRITPAHAGKTMAPGARCGSMTDHPRACGENKIGALELAKDDGSPPRMRGKHTRLRRWCGQRRITPAHAGKTCHPLRARPATPDHPRACGENASTCVPFDGARGSPPRMRGKRSQLSGEVLEHRITPAHAGKTACRPCSPRIRADHPRACGENRTYLTKKQHAGGSPPRMRGKLIPPRKCLYKTRITPAHAGKTCAHDSAHAGVADHPRACGENRSAGVSPTLRRGSPPRMRGKLCRLFLRDYG